MKYIYVQPAIERFEWELKGSIKSLVDLGVPYSDIILLFIDYNNNIPTKFREMGVNVFSFGDYRTNEQKNYIPSVRPYLWFNFLEKYPEYQNETFVYLDSDVVVTSLEAFNVDVTENKWFGSDTPGYLDYTYLSSVKNSDMVINEMIKAHGDVSLDFIKSLDRKTPGAQWVIKNPSKEYWEDVFTKSVDIYKATTSLDTDLQVWTAEMWSQVWTMEKYQIEPIVSDKMKFSFATDELNDNFIIHNAGVASKDNKEGLFFKGDFLQQPKESDLITNEKYAQSIYIKKIKEALY